jgi:glycosyltransferase involved in cell wall biosynthesis
MLRFPYINYSGDVLHPPAPAISLVIPAYNRGSLIAETLESALRQTVPFLEIIVVDDGSSDNTPEVLARYAGRVHAIRVPNGGVQRARNLGVEAARGDYVALCDSDDLLDPSYVATLGAWLSDHPECNSIYTNFVTFDEHGTHADKFAGAPASFFDGAQHSGAFWHAIPDLYARTLAYQPLFPSGNLMRRSQYLELGGYDARFNGVGAEDYEFTLRLVGAGNVALCATPLVRVRRHDGNDSIDNVRQVSGEVKILQHALLHHPQAPAYRRAILDSIEARRRDIFHGAFARGLFDIAAANLRELQSLPNDRKFRLKALIVRLPGPLRALAWRLTR